MLTFLNCDNLSTEGSVSLSSEISGKWLVNEQNSILVKALKEYYTVEISVDTNSTDKVKINNFYNIGSEFNVVGEVTTENTIVIETQSIDGYSFHGEGTVSSKYDQIDWIYYVELNESVDTIIAQYTEVE